MTTGEEEIEAKFYVQDLNRIRARLEELGSQLVQERVLETNLRFDLPGARLRAEGRVLRLRRDTFIMLDELPYGDFVEIEGQNHDSIHSLADQLNLDWDAAIATSYHALFRRACSSLNLAFEDLFFGNFAGIPVDAKTLGVRAADR